jgi:hypothetical protein
MKNDVFIKIIASLHECMCDVNAIFDGRMLKEMKDFWDIIVFDLSYIWFDFSSF